MSRVLPLVLIVLVTVVGSSQAGHEMPFYPSYYPQEIRIETADPSRAAPQLEKSAFHAWLGADPFAGTRLPASVGSAESLGSWLVLTVSPAGRLRTPTERCAAAHDVVASLGPAEGRYLAHPWPVTPYHEDYLQHVDLARAARNLLATSSTGSVTPGLRVAARGTLAEKLVQAPAAGDWDIVLEEVALADLVEPAATSLNGWLGPPWIKEGWFHAWLLLGDGLASGDVRRSAEGLRERLMTGAYAGAPERMNLERRLVSLLTGGCERTVVGYTLRRDYFSAEYSNGVENTARDSQAGFRSPIFFRTVKLKDFPWNGWLTVGTDARPVAAWNPIGGFTDPAGRLLWMIAGDPAAFPEPHNNGWTVNRLRLTGVERGSALRVPAKALAPDAEGRLRPVGKGRVARARLTYRVLASLFHDGTRMTTADALYPYAFAARWSGKRDGSFDPAVERASALARGWLAGVRVLRVDHEVLNLGVATLRYDVPVIEVYLERALGDRGQLATIAPPWSAVPWHLLALMEEAVSRGLAAFSEDEAKRRGVPWLDLARDHALGARLARLLDDLERRAHVPAALAGLVGEAEARQRWAKLKRFHAERRHFLVTNGPYQLDTWSPAATVLKVFRDFSYPLGVGSFDAYAIPLRAYVARTEARGDRIEIWAEVERIDRFGREYRIVAEPFDPKAFERDKRLPPRARWVVLGPDARVVDAGSALPTAAGTFVIALAPRLRPGAYTVVVALTVRDNHVDPHLAVIPLRRDSAS